ncbi:MAG: hypothetical protein J6C87_08970 [Bacteroides sp.]|nr:hypothetical protein [Bacteroides sp.]
MRKKIFFVVAVVVAAASVGYVNYQRTQGDFNDVMLANIAALADNEDGADGGELPEVEIVCNTDKFSAGQCWKLKNMCFRLMTWYDDCEFTGFSYDYCSSVCDI